MSHVPLDSYLPCPPVLSGQSPQSSLAELLAQGLIKRYGGPPTGEVAARVDYELRVIAGLRADAYLLVVAEYVNWAKQRGILVAPGRGAVGSSVVAYALGITDLDPVAHGLLSERFLSTEVGAFPDIDTDLEAGRRREVIEHIVAIYGQNRVAAIASHQDPEIPHAAGVVIADRPISEITPVVSIPSRGHGAWLEAVDDYTGVDYQACERIGLVKFDLLEFKDLQILQRTLKAIEHGRGLTIKPWTPDVPLDDCATFELLSAGDTGGVSQLRAELIQDVLSNLQPTRFADIADLLALYRPKPMQRGILDAYILRSRPHPAWAVSLHPELDGALTPILGETRGLLVYQEQWMRIVHELSGLTLGQADRLRRVLLYGKSFLVEASLRKLVLRLADAGISESAADTLIQWLQSHHDSVSNKSHAVAYGLISYTGAYLKAHYPAEFAKSAFA